MTYLNQIRPIVVKLFCLIFLSFTIHSKSFAGAELVVTLNTGDTFTWQFEEFEDAAEFLSDRFESGRCSPKIANVEIRSVYIDGLDDPILEFSWYHGINTPIAKSFL